MPDVNLNLIQTFYLVARHGTYSAAARVLNISYQSAANHVRRLEQMLGENLLSSQQGGKAIELTPRGRSLFRLLEPEMEIVLSRLSDIIDKQRPILRIGMPQAVFFYLMPKILSQFRSEFPQMEIAVYERDTSLHHLIKEGNLDLCISEMSFGDRQLQQHAMGSYRPALILPKEWGTPPDTRPAFVEWLRRRPMVTFESGHFMRDTTMNFAGQLGFTPSIAVSTSGTSSVKRCVEEGIGFAVIPDWCIEHGERSVYVVDIPGLTKIPLYFCEARFLHKNPFVVALRELCMAINVDEISASVAYDSVVPA